MFNCILIDTLEYWNHSITFCWHMLQKEWDIGNNGVHATFLFLPVLCYPVTVHTMQEYF